MRGNITTSCRKVKSFKTYLKILRMRVKNRNMNRIRAVVNWSKSKLSLKIMLKKILFHNLTLKI